MCLCVFTRANLFLLTLLFVFHLFPPYYSHMPIGMLGIYLLLQIFCNGYFRGLTQGDDGRSGCAAGHLLFW